MTNTCQQNNGPDDLMWSRTSMDLNGICRAGRVMIIFCCYALKYTYIFYNFVREVRTGITENKKKQSLTVVEFPVRDCQKTMKPSPKS